MTVEKIKVNNREYQVTLNDQTQMYVMKLKRLYQQSYSDMDSFDEISVEISSTINNILKNVSPDVKDGDMDGTIQQIMKIYEKTTKK
ncbi:MAG: hypothetical protein DA328_07175 [Nitrososphaeraceae archaeon]|nr:hypothetical protein [Nitrososphaeraceae archaeon]